MTEAAKSALPSLISRHEKEILDDWVKLQTSSDTHRADLVTERDVRSESQRFLEATRTAIASGTDIRTPEWTDVKDLLTELSQSRARQGFSPTETATFVLSLKQPLFARIRTEFAKDPAALADATWAATTLLDKLGLLHHGGLPEGPRERHPAPAGGAAGAVDAGRAPVGQRRRGAPHRHPRQRAHASGHGEPAPGDREPRAPPSPSSTSRASPPWTPWSPSTS